MRVFRFLILLLVISINVGHGYPRAGIKQDLSAEELGDNVTGEQLADDVTGEQLADDVSGEQLADDVTGEQLADDVTGEQLAENLTGEKLDENVTGEKLDENDKVMHVVTNKDDKGPVPGCKTNSFYWNKCNICHCTKAGSVECTAMKCDEPKGSTKLNKKLKSAHYEKLRDLATGCFPGKKVSSENCECECSIQSVLLCHCRLET